MRRYPKNVVVHFSKQIQPQQKDFSEIKTQIIEAKDKTQKRLEEIKTNLDIESPKSLFNVETKLTEQYTSLEEKYKSINEKIDLITQKINEKANTEQLKELVQVVSEQMDSINQRLDEIELSTQYAHNQISDSLLSTHYLNQVLSEDSCFDTLRVSDLRYKDLYGYKLTSKTLIIDDTLKNEGRNGINGFVFGNAGQLKRTKNGSYVGIPVYKDLHVCQGGAGLKDPIGPSISSDSEENINSDEDINYYLATGLQSWPECKEVVRKLSACGLAGFPTRKNDTDKTYSLGGGGLIFIETDTLIFSEEGCIKVNGGDGYSTENLACGGSGGGIILIRASEIILPDGTERPLTSPDSTTNPFLQAYGGKGVYGGQDGYEGLILIFKT